MLYRIILIILLQSAFLNAYQEIANIFGGIIYGGGIKAKDLETLIKKIAYDGTTLTRVLYDFTTIDTSGFYKLAHNVSNQITITVPNVTLDLNGCTVSGGANGIVINGSLANVTIRNGTINGVNDGILVNGGCRNIVLKDVTVKNCLRGVSFDQTNNGIVSHCDFILNTTGVHIDMSHNIYLENCTAHANLQAGFSLLTSTTCTLVNCQAISTGDGNVNVAGNQSNIFGFVSNNGTGNIFERCIANSTQALTATAPETIVAGFGLRLTERCSKIIQCEAGNGMTGPNGLAIPYGIWLESQFDGLTTVTSTNEVPTSSSSSSVAWSPDGNYLVASGSTTGPARIILYQFDRVISQLIEIDNVIVDNNQAVFDAIFNLNWSPSGSYLAASGFIASGTTNNNLIIYRFDSVNKSLVSIAGVKTNGLEIINFLQTVAWSPDGRYLAAGVLLTDTPTGFALFIYRFDPVAQTLTQIDAINPDNVDASVNGIASVQWSPDGNYLAVGGTFNGNTANALYMYSFNKSTQNITLVDSVSPDGGGSSDAVNAVAWSPDGQYLAVGGTFAGITGNDLMLYKFDRVTKKLIKVSTVAIDGSVRSLSWTANNNYLAAAGVTVADDFFVYSFNRATEQLTQVAATTLNNIASFETTMWSPDGVYLAVGGTTSDTNNNIFVFTGLDFPRNNVINNNTLYCDAGSTSPGGVGICGSSIENFMIGNSAYSNPITPAIVPTNYQFVCNVFNPLFGDEPTELQNISLNSKTPIPSRFDIPAAINRLEVLAQSLVDNLL